MRVLLIFILCFPGIQLLGQKYEVDEIYVKLKSNTGIQTSRNSNTVSLAEFKNELNLSALQKQKLEEVKAPFYFSKSAGMRQTFRVKASLQTDLKALVDDLNKDPDVEYAERIPVVEKSLVPDDLGSNTLSGQWALHAIQAQGAWDINTGNSSIVIAVVDDAIQTDHIDLIDNCLEGWDVADKDNDPRPKSTCHSHGTHVAGIIGASSNNSKGIASIGYNISILPVKATFDSDATCRIIDMGYEGVQWAAENGANIINMSWGHKGSSITGRNIISKASSLGIILVASAGNSNTSSLRYPAAYENVISVAATDINDVKASFSNYGNWVAVSAPGVSIKSTVPFNAYNLNSGTSMASPMVASLCGLVWSADLSQTPQSVINCILNTADNIDAQNPGYVGQLGKGRINAYQALKCVSSKKACEKNKTFTSPISGFLDQEVQNWIEGKTNNIIKVGANVTYDAGNQVRLRPGFKAIAGSRFHAIIDGCEEDTGTRFSTGYDFDTNINNFELNIYPNPTIQMVKINYTLPKEDEVTLILFDTTGKRLANLAENQPQQAGQHKLELDASNLPIGIYYLKLHTNENNIIKKLMIAK